MIAPKPKLYPQLRSMLHARGITTTYLAQEWGTTRQNVSNKLGGKAEFKLKEVHDLMRLLGNNDFHALFPSDGKSVTKPTFGGYPTKILVAELKKRHGVEVFASPSNEEILYINSRAVK